jgi:hypothetical protein
VVAVDTSTMSTLSKLFMIDVTSNIILIMGIILIMLHPSVGKIFANIF